MSATALTCTKDTFVLLSDGRCADGTGGPAIDHQTRKVWRLRPNIGLSWTGWYPRHNIRSAMVSHLDNPALQTPRQVATAAGRFLASQFTDDMVSMLDPFRYCILIAGYHGPDPVLYQIDSTREDIFSPQPVDIATGNSAMMGISGGLQEYTALLDRYIDLYRNTTYAAKIAFTELIKTHQAQGDPVGGEIFTETLQPRLAE